ncbi:MAG: ABC transporter substrate-binding protein, partial [Candidatus Rokuibacteriota bacterium]
DSPGPGREGSTMLRPRALRLAALLTLLLVTAALGLSEASAQAPRKGGALRVGMIGEPPSLDPHATTATITREIGINMFETLYTLDAKYQPVPLLAEGHDALDGAKRYVIRLRKGVRFHNGKELTAADVVASLQRWGKVAGAGKAVFKTVEAVEAKGPHVVEVRLTQPSAVLPTVLASIASFAAIYPKEVVDATGDGQLKEYVGTGPFKFAEHRPDRHIRLVRFDGYAARPEAASGLGGQRAAHLDEILFLPVPDYATRQAGMQTGEYDFIQQVKPDQYDRIRSMSGVEPVIAKPYGWATLVLNLKQGVMSDLRVRQAVQAAVDVEPAMLAAMGHRDFFRLDPGLFFVEQAWHSKAGATLYNQRDKEKARRLLREAGYQGQPVRWIVTTEYEHHYKPALVAKSQLEEVGLKIDLQVSDWATVVQRRSKPELWDIFSTAFVFDVEPSTGVPTLCEWPGWWCTAEKEQLLQAMARELDFKKRYAMWERVQALFYEEAARIRLGDYFRLDARRKHVQGYQGGPYMHFWNVWMEK